MLPIHRDGATHFRVLTEDDAVLVVIFRRLAGRCAREGWSLSPGLVEKVVAMAKSVGVCASDSTSFAREGWLESGETMRVVEESGNVGRLRRLNDWLSAFSLAEIEGFTLASSPYSP